MFLLGVPLLIISFAIYNIVVFILPGFAWSMEVLRFPLASGGEFGITAGDLMIAGSILILLVEMLKAALALTDARTAAVGGLLRSCCGAAWIRHLSSPRPRRRRAPDGQ